MTYSTMALGQADVHLHTLASDGLIGARDLVDYVEAHTDLDVIAVTDHDEASAALDQWVRSGALLTSCIMKATPFHPSGQ